MFNFKLIIVLLTICFSQVVSAKEYICKIKNVSQINENGYFVKHGWSANYMNREFTVDRETGRVLSTTALKQRLNNGDLKNSPIILNKDNADSAYRVFTHYKESGKYALLEIRDHGSFKDKPEKPYFFHTDVDMILSGTCTIKK